jgi:hypothetical protein
VARQVRARYSLRGLTSELDGTFPALPVMTIEHLRLQDALQSWGPDAPRSEAV